MKWSDSCCLRLCTSDNRPWRPPSLSSDSSEEVSARRFCAALLRRSVAPSHVRAMRRLAGEDGGVYAITLVPVLRRAAFLGRSPAQPGVRSCCRTAAHKRSMADAARRAHDSASVCPFDCAQPSEEDTATRLADVIADDAGDDGSAIAMIMDGTSNLAANQHIRFGPMLLKPTKKLALFVAPAEDDVNHAVAAELCRNGWHAKKATNEEEALRAFGASLPNVLVLDARRRRKSVDNWDPCHIAHALHTHTDGTDCVFIALVDKWPEDKRLKALADAGISQVIRISAGVTSFRDALQLLEIVWPLQVRLRACHALFSVLDDADVPIEITDDSRFVQYVNRAYELSTGCLRAEVLGTTSSDLRRKSLVPHNQPEFGVHRFVPPQPSSSSINFAVRHASGTHSSEDEPAASSPGTVESKQPLGSHHAPRVAENWLCIAVASPSESRHSSQYVYMKKPIAIADGRFISRDLSLRSVRSNSQSAFVEAPITEVLNLLRDAQQRTQTDGEAQRLIKESMRVLSSSELYAPLITRFRDNDRIATGYYDGLVRLHHQLRPRKKSLVEAMRENKRGPLNTETARRTSAEVKLALSKEADWDFDILELERLTEKRPLAHLGMKVFERWKVAELLRCSDRCLSTWFQVMESHYHPTNPYHNATHAADVLQATAYFLDAQKVASNVEQVHAMAALIAATIHDLDHPGRGNAFLINTRHSLALLYNDVSVLENHHAALAFQLTLKEPGINIFEAMSREDFGTVRQAVVDMVLATDMRRHFEYLTKFQQSVPSDEESPTDRDATSMTICRMLIKCADIGNPARAWPMCSQWAYRIVEEYFDQTAEEREKGLPLTMEVFDRPTCNVPLTQCGFTDMFAREMFTSWCEFAEIPHLMVQLEENYKRWRAEAVKWTPARNTSLLSDS
uniref:Phosphodiesterase n=1 Tax=Plectus sambesii TaxID=2011161 RepID=A0A914XGW7_9BILA